MEQNKNKSESLIVEDDLILKTKDWEKPLDAINDAIFILNKDQVVVQANQTAEIFFNLLRGELIGKYCWEIVGCKSKQEEECPCLRAQISCTRENIEFKLGDVWLQVLVDPIFSANGVFLGAVHIFRNISARKQTEDALRESEFKYHTLFEKMLNGYALHETICDEKGKPVDYRYIDVNPAFESITGYKAVDILGRTALELTPDIDPFLIETYGKVALSGDPISFDFKSFRTGNHYLFTAYQPKQGQFACIFQEITEQKNTENALRESEQKFKLLAENPIVGIFISQDRKFIYVNDRLAEMHGFSKEEILGTPNYTLIHPDYRDSIDLNLQERITQGEKYKQRYEMLRIKKNGGTFWGGGTVTRGEYNGKSAIFGSVIDISESKRAEEELKKSEERYKEIVEGTDDLIIKVDHNGTLVYANYMANKIFGLPQSDVIGMHISKCIHPEDKDNTRHIIDETVAKKASSATFENRQISQTGEVRHLSWTSKFHYDSLGNLVDVTSIARDITRRREMEEELKKAHDELEQRVHERTQALQMANNNLNEKTKNLEELNTALKILLEKREEYREENGEKILLNVNELIIPYITKLKNSSLNENQKNYLELLESGLEEIISPFAKKLTSRYMHITPRELQVGNFVKQGKTSKEIADILNTTERTVVAHRANLRKKLNLGKKTNLRTYLLTLQ